MTKEQEAQLQELLNSIREERIALAGQAEEMKKVIDKRIDRIEQRLELLAVEIRREIRNYGR